jgi:hypothetical protein
MKNRPLAQAIILSRRADGWWADLPNLGPVLTAYTAHCDERTVVEAIRALNPRDRVVVDRRDRA